MWETKHALHSIGECPILNPWHLRSIRQNMQAAKIHFPHVRRSVIFYAGCKFKSIADVFYSCQETFFGTN